MTNRRYYSSRTGKNPLASKLDLPNLLLMFRDIYNDFNSRDYFQESFGYNCLDLGFVPGKLGPNVDAQILRRLRKSNLWPIDQFCFEYEEDDIFDMIEFLFDHVSKPIEGQYHSYGDCGWHYETFNSEDGKSEFREEINLILSDYGEGFILSENGEILTLPERGLGPLLDADVPSLDLENVNKRVEGAIQKYRLSRSSIDNKRDAVRDLADVLEYLRPKLKSVISSQDESEIFNLANNFGIRHHNQEQKTEFEKSIWYSWLFYYYLATIHAVLRLLNKES